MHRFYANDIGIIEGFACLTDEDTSHALRVLRLKIGDPIELMCNGIRYAAELAESENGTARVRILTEIPSAEPSLRVTLYQGIPKSDKMDLIVQKATEIGIHSVVPVLMDRCVSRPDPADFDRKCERWQKIAREAGKQSGRELIPEIQSLTRLSSLSSLFATHDAVIVPWEDQEGYGPKAFASDHPDLHSLGIVIGPEGGISASEIETLKHYGCHPITLGPRILRTETAGLAALCAIMCLYGEME